MTGKIEVKWNTKNLEIKTKSVEKQLQAIVIQVTTLVNTTDSNRRRKGKSKNAAALISAVEKATNAFIEKGQQIANENPDVTKEMLAAVEEVRQCGQVLSVNSKDFTVDPCSSNKRSVMVMSARKLLSAVTRLLILADMVDVHLLLASLGLVKTNLEALRNPLDKNYSKNVAEFQKNTDNLLNHVAMRQRELQDPQSRDDLAAARAQLKKFSPMLLSATKAYINHPNLAAAKNNQDYVIRQMCSAVDVIGDVAQGRRPQNSAKAQEDANNLANSLNQLDDLLQIEPLSYNKIRSKAMLEQQLNSITKGAFLFTTSEDIKSERKERILAGCDAVKNALQGLLTAYMNNTGKEEKSAELASAIDDMEKKTKDLRRQLRKAVADRVTHCFLDSHTPLEALVTAAKKGDVKAVDELSKDFAAHATKLVEVALLTCNLSNNEEGVKMVRYAASQLESHAPGVINAAKTLAAYPKSETALENMKTFEESWNSLVKILTEAVDEITIIDDVLAAFENNVLDDINSCFSAVHEGNVDLLRTMAMNVHERSVRINDLTEAEMDNYEPCPYTRRVLAAIKVLNTVLPKFDEQVKRVVDNMSSNPPKDIDENEFIDTTRLVYDSIREIRRAVLMNRADEELDPEEVELEKAAPEPSITSSNQEKVEEGEDVGGITVAREVMSKLPEEEKQKILTEVAKFQSEKQTFDKEVAKWDDVGNDIVVMAKFMCMIMMQMADFVRQRGPLKSTTDVINAAKKISQTGVKLDKLARQIADQCPESSTKKDLLAYLERVAMYSHQINIISKVKADVQNSNNEELIAAGVESATSLIENAKNLMNAVVLTVKASYVASTKYSRQGALLSPVVVWKMKVPEKKPLVIANKPKLVNAVVRKASQKRPQNPIQVLSEFHSATEIL